MSFVCGWERGLRRGAAAGRLAVVLLAATLAAQPSRAQTSGASTTTQATSGLMLYNPPGSSYYARLDTIGTAVTVPAGRAQAFHALRSVYAELRIPLTEQDSVSGWLGTRRYIRTQDLGGIIRLSRVMDCGTEMTGPVADVARIEIALVTFVRAVGADSTAVRTAFVASSQSVNGEQRDRVQCSTTGYLENWIRGRLLERIGRH